MEVTNLHLWKAQGFTVGVTDGNLESGTDSRRKELGRD